MDECVAKADLLIDRLIKRMENPAPQDVSGPLFAGVDIGTANVVTVIVDGNGHPVDGEITPASVTREGIIVEYIKAVKIVNGHLDAIRSRMKLDIRIAMSAVPPNTEMGNRKVTQNILESAELDVLGLIDEPEAASKVLGLREGMVIDVGGGTTGISIIQDGKVVSSVDEPTGGRHFSLVLAGHMGISIEEAEELKKNPGEQKRLFPILRPVMEKVAGIACKSLHGHKPPKIYLVGGACSFLGFAKLIQQETGIPTAIPRSPLMTTPLGIALACWEQAQRQSVSLPA